MKLYDIVDAYRKLMDSLDINPETGEVINREVLGFIANQTVTFKDNAEVIACYIKELRAYAEALKSEEVTLAFRRHNIEIKIKALSQYLADCMKKIDTPNLKTRCCELSVQISEQVAITDAALLATQSDFMRVKAPEPDKVAIKSALKQGKTIPGAELITVQNLQIK